LWTTISTHLANGILLSITEFSHAFDPNSMIYRSRGGSPLSQTRINDSQRADNNLFDC
jgi:hypothetical protein